MTPRRRRLILVGLMLLGVAGAVVLALTAFQENLLYYYTPTQVSAGEAPRDRVFRVGGMVTAGSFKREPGSLEARFVLTDYENDIVVSYTGVLPDLFREGQGIVARGKLGADGVFVAEEVLAKHDENYMPPDVADTLRKQGDKRVTTPIATSTVENEAP
jgi:cytochrome c-type biogenesis protein CcmE